MDQFLQSRFKKVFTTNLWGSRESRSGKGSELKQTQKLINEIPKIIEKYNISSILDAPCGDYNYMKEIKLKCNYIGVDIVPELIELNLSKYKGVDFRCLDITSSNLPKCDLVLVRDCLSHLTNKDVKKAIKNIEKSGAKFLLVTSYPDHQQNSDLTNGQWRRLNMEKKPFNLISKDRYFEEGDSINKDKSLILVELRA